MKLQKLWALAVVGAGLIFTAIVLAADTPAANAPAETSSPADAKFVPLFNGHDLTGWHGDTDLWKVVDGVIVGSTDDKQIKHNTFLIYDKPYKNFVLKATFKLRNHNSGVQFRSKELDDFVCSGYQADMAEKKYTGNLYEEKGRGTLVQVDEDELKKHYVPGEWAEYTITADGPHIQEQVNGFTTVDYTEKDAQKGASDGVIALQLHMGPKMQVEFKNIEIMDLP
ncbi:MAG TPA: DUF1080 domain-containing protein [Pirellulales bacterium]|nr:DUF1080 domain-containing protein [Pirellulales bacterium]